MGLFRLYLISYIAPTGLPQNVNHSASSRAVNISWDAIECSERNGEVIGYSVEFQEEGGTSFYVSVAGQAFAASGLSPHQHYSISVAGLTLDGIGPSTMLNILTEEEGNMFYWVQFRFNAC